MEINGVAHVFITAGDFERSRAFYRQLLPFLGLKTVMDNEFAYYCIGGRTGFGIEPPAPEHKGERFVQNRVGLHHVCFRARERADVDSAYAFLQSIGAAIVHGPQEDGWARGYYSVLFEDPDGVRLDQLRAGDGIAFEGWGGEGDREWGVGDFSEHGRMREGARRGASSRSGCVRL